MRLSVIFALLMVLACPAFVAHAAASQTLSILRITPNGDDVPVGQQLVIQFNRAVVPVGRMERSSAEIPIIIEPKLECQWRWLNTSALACNLDEANALQSATKYRVTVNKGIVAEDGAGIDQPFEHIFTTERPDVRYAWFSTWKSAGTPVLRLTFNQSVSAESVADSLFMEAAEGLNSQPYRLNVEADPNESTEPDYLPVTETQNGATNNEATRKGAEARRVWMVSPADELPLDTAMRLQVKPGLRSALGLETGIGEREVVRFHTFPAFSFLGISCYSNDNDNEMVLIPANTKDPETLCNPMTGAALAFSTPVFRSQAKDHILFSPRLNINAEEDLWGGSEDYSQLARAHEKDRRYHIWLPAGLKAAAEYRVQSDEQERNWLQRVWHWIKSLFVDVGVTDIRDEFDRPLNEPIDMVLRTDHRKPNFVLDHTDAVIESGVDSEVPLYVNNLDSITFNYRRVTAAGAKAELSSKQSVPVVQDVQFAIPLQVRDMLDGKSGAIYGHLETNPNVYKMPWEHRLFAQVTPYQVHAKMGHYNSVVWVTDMATGLPVADAKVTIYKDKLSELGAIQKALASSVTDANGISTLAGSSALDPELSLYRSWNDEDDRLFVRVDKGDNMALLPISNPFMLSSYRSVGESVYPDNKKRYGHLKSWGMTAQGIYRAGDTIQYKLYVRDQDNDSLTRAPKDGYRLEILDPTGNKVHEVKHLSLNDFGAYAGEFATNKQAAVGWYEFKLIAEFGHTDSEYDQSFIFSPMRVLVSDFTPSPFKVTNQVNGDLFHAGQEVELNTVARLHSGGAYTDANARITAMLESKPFSSKHAVGNAFTFGSYRGETDQQQVFQKMDTVGSTGENTLSFTIPEQKIYYGRLMFESAVQDDRGKYVAATSYADYAGVDRFVGLNMTDWLVQAGKAVDIRYLVADARGNPVADTDVQIVIERQETKAAKVKGAGNAYLTEFTNAWVESGDCEGRSSQEASACSFTAKEAGYYRATASIKDTQGHAHQTEMYLYATGSGHVLWNEPNDYSLEIIPEKPSYQVGDTARYLIKNPYPGAKALITIERYGVLDHFVQTLEGSTPVIEFEVKPDYIPGFYLSVVAFSPRVDKPVEGQVDLGKPAFKIGYLTVPILDEYKEIIVTAKSEHELYKPRETVRVDLHAAPRFSDKQEPIELAVLVLDESVFDLIAGGLSYFNPYDGFYQLDSLDLRNYSLLTRLIGRQKFEKKGANPGGDGGADLAMRNLFKFVSYWNPSVRTDANGKAQISFEVPDNLTGWRVLALAVTPTDRMGLGETNFKVNRPTEVRPVMPNQVTEGDRFDAGFSVMNRTDSTRDIVVHITASGDLDAKAHPTTLVKQITLAPYKRETVWMPLQSQPVKAVAEQAQGEIRFEVSAEDATDGDGIRHALVVRKRRSLETAANYGTTTDDAVEESIAFPDNIHADVGELSIVAAASVIGNIEGAFKYLRDYPYFCWEQILTKGVMASHYLNLRNYMPPAFEWDEAASLAQDTLKMAGNFQAPNGGMAYFIARDDYVDPYLSAYTALAFNWLRESGHTIPVEVEDKLYAYLNTLLKQDAYPDFYDKGMASTVRAVALAALAENNLITLADLERFKPHVAQMSLFGKTYFVQAAMRVEGGDAYVDEVSKLILSHANQSGGKFSFNEELDDSYSRILSTPLRENCAILSTFSKMAETEQASLVEDIPFKLVRMITQARGSRTHWDNTQENVFCLNGLTDYARRYEKVKPDMQVAVKLDETSFGQAVFSDVKDAPMTFTHPIEAKDVGRKATATISREGDGRLYYATRLRYAPLAEHSSATNSGIEITREYSVQRDGKWELLPSPAAILQAELIRVDLFLSVPAARHFVVVDDPVPGGLEPVNRDLATASIVDADKGKFEASGGSWWFKYSDWISYLASRWSFYHQELRHDSVRFYADYLPAGNYHLSYTAQAIAPGEFTIMPVHAEEMYDPDVYGKGVTGQLRVGQQAP